jgi:hypothetical protein
LKGGKNKHIVIWQLKDRNCWGQNRRPLLGTADKYVSAATYMWCHSRGTVGNGVFYWVHHEAI